MQYLDLVITLGICLNKNLATTYQHILIVLIAVVHYDVETVGPSFLHSQEPTVDRTNFTVEVSSNSPDSVMTVDSETGTSTVLFA